MGLFVPSITALPEIRELLAGTGLPFNVMALEGLPEPVQRHAAGARWLSAGAAISARVWDRAHDLARGFLEDGRLEGSAMPFPDLQKLFA